MKDECQLAKRLCAGDVKTLEEIISRFTPYVCTIIRNFSCRCLSEQDVEDLTADVFVRLWKYRSGLNPEQGIRAYLSAITRSCVKNFLAKHRADTLDISEYNPLSPMDTVELCMTSMAMKCLHDGLDSLEKTEREIFVRFYFFGEKTTVISKAVGLSDGAIRTRLTRTRKKIRDYMIERGYNYDEQ